ncbi:FtsW/RodA/SpoVE family cell cycle protein [Flindersiella endophytica]
MSTPQAEVPLQFRKRRGVELALLLVALGVAVGSYAIVGITMNNGQVPSRIAAYGAGLALLVGAAHVLIRATAPYADPILLPCVTLLNGLGLAMIYRLDLANAEKAEALGKAIPSPNAPKQLTWTAIGVVLFVLVLLLVRDHRRLQRVTYLSLLAGIVLLLLPLVPGLGTFFQGARIWIQIGPLSFQPGEIAKFCLIVFFAGYLVVKKDALALAGRRFLGLDLPRGRDLGPILLAWAISLGILVFQRDLGTSLLFFGVFVVLLYVSTERPGWIVIGLTLFLVGAYGGYQFFSHVQIRVNAWLHPFDDPDASFQIIQSLYGLAYGGMLGRGLGQGHPDLVPVAHSDFIIAALGEELGLAGLMAIILLYGVIVERGLRTALLCRDQYGKLLAAGFAAVFALQVFVVVGGVTKLIPLTGLTTPFLSYGGSSLIANWALVALLLRISDYARRPAAPLPAPTDEAMTQVVARR